ncbi:hypothetical protein ZOSMA_41G00410 [Zostera marina]|uniref:J domain-containing protein n=1 Tax=Zostera marina TaxID=29655 RepID=A0A0K9P2J9_ZOSMR|nr:hypothetical protein ZOSMA_41G00410 [Zostera marina]
MEDDYKTKLAEEICSISKLFVSCTHKIRRYPHKPAFVDWYLILQIGEDSGIDEISKRYRKLALQLHPDKNKHSSATAAFRLIFEAYKCLIDEGTRKAFDAERCYNICTNCINKTSPMKSNLAKNNRRTHGNETDMKRTRMGNEHSKASRCYYPIPNTFDLFYLFFTFLLLFIF